MNQNPIFGEHTTDRARERYDALVGAVARAVDEADPKSLLELGAPEDEYSPEIDAITPRVAKAGSQEEVRSILHEEFERWFGAGSAGPVDAYDVPAIAIWQAVLAFREGT